MANDFTLCEAAYQFESGALTTDSSGKGNTLTAVNTPAEDTTNYIEGSCCVDYEYDDTDSHYRTDANLSGNFPFKGSSSNLNMTVCFFFKAESSTASLDFVSKYIANNGQRTFRLWLDSSSRLLVRTGYDSGASNEDSNTTDATTDGTWYHVGFCLNGTTGAIKLRIWTITDRADRTSGALFQEFTDTQTNTPISVGTAPFTISGSGSTGIGRIDALMDEVLVFTSILSSDDIDAVRQGTYGAGAGLSIPVAMYHYMNH